MKTLLACALLFLVAACRLPAQMVVTTLTDDPTDPGSFRYAVNAVANHYASSISFNIPTDPSDPNYQGPPIISLTAPLPVFPNVAKFYGNTQLAADGVSPSVQIDGSQVPGDGIVLQCEGSEVHSLILTGFGGSAILITGTGATSSVKVDGCYIGIDPTSSPTPNGTGITITNRICIIGGTTANVISGNNGAGIVLTGTAARGNTILNNLIGLDPTGANTIPNNDGIQIVNGASANLVGASGTTGANTISGNTRWGILVQGGSANSILNSFIGTDISGNNPGGNGSGGIVNDLAAGQLGGGIFIDNSGFSTISGNVVSANFGPGIQLTRGANNTGIVNNFVGVDSTGEVLLGNQGDGVLLGDSTSVNPTVWNNTIGGYDASPTDITTGSGNIISGNGLNGINIISGSNDSIQGNSVGLDAQSTTMLANGGDGIQITGTNETIGGLLDGFGNTVSGNTGDGIQLNGCQFVTVENNSVGVDAINGNNGFPNSGNGITIQGGSQNQIGASGTSARNWICSNKGSGIWISSNYNVVQGNYVGLGGDGASILGNGTLPASDAGIKIVSGTGNSIGAQSAPNYLFVNVVCGNIGDGIRLDGPSVTGNFVFGNWIGFLPDPNNLYNPTADNTTVNGQNAIGIYSGADTNRIGDVTPTAGNWIATASNDTAVYLMDGDTDSSTIQNSIRGNSIMMLNTPPANFPNNYPIALFSSYGDGSVNQPGGVRPGANNLLDFPDVAGIGVSGTQFVLSGTYSGVPMAHVNIDIYQADPADANSILHYVQTNSLTTDAAGNCLFNIPLWGNLAAYSVAATATDDAGNTSEFSNCLIVPEVFQFATVSSTVTVNEAAGVLQLTVSRMGYLGAANDVMVTTQDISGLAGVDYTAINTDVQFAAGQSTAVVNIPITNNLNPNGQRLFNVSLSNPTSGIAGPMGSITVSILDNQAPNGVFSVVVGSPFIDLGTASAPMIITRNGGSGSPATVRYSTVNGTAVAGFDYTAKSGTASFAAGQLAATVNVPLLVNRVYKPSKSFAFNLLTSSTGTALVMPKSATQTICDTRNPYGTLEFTAPAFIADESATNAIVTIARLGGATGTVTVRFNTTDGTAVDGANYQAALRVIAFRPGVKSASVAIPIYQDGYFSNPSNQFLVGLSTPTGGATLGAGRSATVTEVDCDNPNGTFELTGTATTAARNASSVTVWVQRLGGTTGPVSVPFTVQNGTARSGVTYLAKPGAFVFRDGDMTAGTAVTLVSGARSHPAQTFTLTLGNPTGGGTLGVKKTITVTIPAK